MHGLYLVSVWLHILAATVWIGGMAFLVMVIVPTIRRPENRSIAARLVSETGLRYRTVGWTCLAIMLLTGIFNIGYRGYRWGDVWSGELWQGAFGTALAWKLGLVVAVGVLSAVHDFFIGPRAATVWMEAPDSTEALRLRKLASRMGRMTALLALAVVFLAVAMLRGW